MLWRQSTEYLCKPKSLFLFSTVKSGTVSDNYLLWDTHQRNTSTCPVLKARVFSNVSQNRSKRPLSSLCLSLRPSAWNNSAPTERIFMKFYIWGFFENTSRKLKIIYILTRITGTLHEDQYTYFITHHQAESRDNCLILCAWFSQRIHSLSRNTRRLYTMTYYNILF